MAAPIGPKGPTNQPNPSHQHTDQPLQVVMEAEGKEGARREVWLARKQLKGQDSLLRGFVAKLRE